MQPAKILSPALTAQEYKRHEKNRLTVRRLPSNYKFARKADLPQSAISIIIIAVFALLSICLPTQNLRQHLNAATDILS